MGETFGQLRGASACDYDFREAAAVERERATGSIT